MEYKDLTQGKMGWIPIPHLAVLQDARAVALLLVGDPGVAGGAGFVGLGHAGLLVKRHVVGMDMTLRKLEDKQKLDFK